MKRAGKNLEQRQAEMRKRQSEQRAGQPITSTPPMKPVIPAATGVSREWLSVSDVVAITGWSKDHAARQLLRLFYEGDPGVIDGSAGLGRKKKHLQISRKALDELLESMRGVRGFQGFALDNPDFIARMMARATPKKTG